MIIFHGDAERVRVHEWLELKARFPHLYNATANFGGPYGIARSGKNKKGEENKEGKRWWRWYTAARRAKQ